MSDAAAPLGIAQRHATLRKALLEPDEARRLSRLDALAPIRDTTLQWLKILAAWAFVAWSPAVIVVLVALPVIGTSRYALQVLAHDGIHRRLFSSAYVNDLFTDVFLLGSIGAVVRLSGRNHLLHHQRLGSDDDPDRFKYGSYNKTTTRELLAYLSGVSGFALVIRRAFLPTERATRDAGSTGTGLRYAARDIAIIGIWQALLIVGLSWYIGWWAYPVLWLLPAYLFGYCGDMARQFLEHAHPERDEIADRHRLITHSSNPVERIFLSPLNMNLHTAHHLWPSIPYYNLPEADRIMHARAASDETIWRGSYLGSLREYWSALPLAPCRPVKPA